MATYKRFEELPVWQDAAGLAASCFELAEDDALRRRGDAASQLARAALSVSNNIAEGFERGTTQELLTFLYIARGSAGEVRSILLVLERLRGLGHLKSEISNLKSTAESISRQLRAWADTLQNSDVRGTRYLNDAARETDARQKRQAEAWAKIDAAAEAARKEREAQRAKERNASESQP